MKVHYEIEIDERDSPFIKCVIEDGVITSSSMTTVSSQYDCDDLGADFSYLDEAGMNFLMETEPSFMEEEGCFYRELETKRYSIVGYLM